MDIEIDHLEVNNIFLGVLSDVSETMLNTKLSYSEPDITMSSIMPSKITSTINISGFLKEKPFLGLFAVSWPEDLYIKLASEMLMEDYTEINEENADAGCELLNIIFGNCKPKLNESGYKLDMTIPMLMSGDNLEILSLKANPSMLTVVNSTLGEFHVVLSLSLLKDKPSDNAW